MQLKGFPSRRDSIIFAAIEIISDNGIQGLSTKEIANKQGISESILYKHFKSLDDVIVAIVEYFLRFDCMIENTVLRRRITYREKILEYIRSFVELYESYPALTAIILNYETLLHHVNTRHLIVNDIIDARIGFIRKLIEDGQQICEIGSCYTSEELAIIIAGTIERIILDWKLAGYCYSLKDKVLMITSKILNSCQ